MTQDRDKSLPAPTDATSCLAAIRQSYGATRENYRDLFREMVIARLDAGESLEDIAYELAQSPRQVQALLDPGEHEFTPDTAWIRRYGGTLDAAWLEWTEGYGTPHRREQRAVMAAVMRETRARGATVDWLAGWLEQTPAQIRTWLDWSLTDIEPTKVMLSFYADARVRDVIADRAKRHNITKAELYRTALDYGLEFMPRHWQLGMTRDGEII